VYPKNNTIPSSYRKLNVLINKHYRRNISSTDLVVIRPTAAQLTYGQLIPWWVDRFKIVHVTSLLS